MTCWLFDSIAAARTSHDLDLLTGDDKTIADFRTDNGAALRKVCARFVELCQELLERLRAGNLCLQEINGLNRLGLSRRTLRRSTTCLKVRAIGRSRAR